MLNTNPDLISLWNNSGPVVQALMLILGAFYVYWKINREKEKKKEFSNPGKNGYNQLEKNIAEVNSTLQLHAQRTELQNDTVTDLLREIRDELKQLPRAQ